MIEAAAQNESAFAVLGTLGINWKLFIAQLLNFIIVFLVLTYFVFRPLSKVLRNRQKTIEDGLENAKKAQENLLEAEMQLKQKIVEGREQARAITIAAKEETERIIANAKIQAQMQAEHMLDEAKKQIAQEQGKMREEIKTEAVSLVFATAEKILGEKLDERKESDLIKKMLGV